MAVRRPGRFGAWAAAAVVILIALTGCGRAGDGAGGDPVPVVISAPLSTEPWIAGSIERGARLAVDEINADGGVNLEGGKRTLELVVLDNASSPATALANAREAVQRKAAVLLTDGTGVPSVGDITDRAALPTFVLFQGGPDLIDPQRHPSVFRLAPADAIMTRRLADYIAGSGPKVALLTDDSAYGGRVARRCARRSRSTRSMSSPTRRSRAAPRTSRRRCSPRAAPAPTGSSSGRAPPPSPLPSRPCTRPAGTCRCSPGRPARTRWSASASPPTPSG